MDQAVLQRVTLARTSGTLCWTVWGAREAAKPAHMDREISFSDQRLISWPTRRESGVYSGFPGWPIAFAMLQCIAGTLLRRRHSGSTWTVLQIFFSLRLRDNACFDDESTATASMSSGTTIRCWPCLIVPGTFYLLTWHGSHVHPEMH